MKYELTEDIREFEGHTLKRLRLVKENDIIGGWVNESFSINENCAIGQDAMICDSAYIEDSYIGEIPSRYYLFDKRQKKDVPIEDSVIIKGCAYVRKSSHITEKSILSDEVEVKTSIIKRSKISNKVHISDSFLEDSICSGTARIFDTHLSNCRISGNVEIYGASMTYADIQKSSDFVVFGIPKVEGEYQFEVSAYEYNDLDIDLKPSRSRNITFYKSLPCYVNHYQKGAILVRMSDSSVILEMEDLHELPCQIEGLIEELGRIAQKTIQC